MLKDRDFIKFWVGQSISVFGSQFSPLAIGAIAFSIVGEDGFVFGVLQFINTVPFLAFGLLVGVYVDRHRRRRILILSDLGRAFVLFLIPLSAVFLVVTMNLLYLVTLLAGILTLFFEIAYQAYIPSLVQKAQIVEANSKLEASRATAQVAGPGAAGFAISVLTAPIAVLADTFGYVSSFLSLLLIRKPDVVENTGPQRSTWHDVREGLSVVFGDPRLRSIAATTGTLNLFGSAAQALFFPYFLGTLRMTVPELGIAFAIGSVGGVVGALTATRVAKRLGVGLSVILGALLSSFVWFSVYFANPGNAFVIVVFANFVSSVGVLIYNITQVSYRQALVARELQGRMNATMRTIVWGVIPLGSLAGGAISVLLGIHLTIGLMILLSSLGFLWVVFSPLRRVRVFPSDS